MRTGRFACNTYGTIPPRVNRPYPKPTRIGLINFLEEALFNGSIFSHVVLLLLLYNVAGSFEVFDDEFWYAAPNGDAGLGQRMSNDVHLFLAV